MIFLRNFYNLVYFVVLTDEDLVKNFQFVKKAGLNILPWLVLGQQGTIVVLYNSKLQSGTKHILQIEVEASHKIH